jgi:hypothetical protein
VRRALVVVGETAGPRADLDLSPLHPDHLRPVGDGLARRPGVRLDRLVALDHLQQLEHRLVVLVLVREDQVVDEAIEEQAVVLVVEVDRVEHVQGALADLAHVRAQFVAPQDRQLVARRARVLDRVVEAPELAAHRPAT